MRFKCIFKSLVAFPDRSRWVDNLSQGAGELGSLEGACSAAIYFSNAKRPRQVNSGQLESEIVPRESTRFRHTVVARAVANGQVQPMSPSLSSWPPCARNGISRLHRVAVIEHHTAFRHDGTSVWRLHFWGPGAPNATFFPQLRKGMAPQNLHVRCESPGRPLTSVAPDAKSCGALRRFWLI